MDCTDPAGHDSRGGAETNTALGERGPKWKARETAHSYRMAIEPRSRKSRCAARATSVPASMNGRGGSGSLSATK